MIMKIVMKLFEISFGGLFNYRYVRVIVDDFFGDVSIGDYFSGTPDFDTISPHDFY